MVVWGNSYVETERFLLLAAGFMQNDPVPRVEQFYNPRKNFLDKNFIKWYNDLKAYANGRPHNPERIQNTKTSRGMVFSRRRTVTNDCLYA